MYASAFIPDERDPAPPKQACRLRLLNHQQGLSRGGGASDDDEVECALSLLSSGGRLLEIQEVCLGPDHYDVCLTLQVSVDSAWIVMACCCCYNPTPQRVHDTSPREWCGLVLQMLTAFFLRVYIRSQDMFQALGFLLSNAPKALFARFQQWGSFSKASLAEANLKRRHRRLKDLYSS